MWHTQQIEVTGKGHILNSIPCQDKTYTLCENGVTAIALADGAGSQPLSHYGAMCATKTICRVLCDKFDVFSTVSSPFDMKQDIILAVQNEIKQKAYELKSNIKALSCTLLAVAVKGDKYLIFHIGDGVIGFQKEGKILVASKPENGEFANTTNFITSKNAILNAKVMRGTQSKLEGFILISDGCENTLYEKQKEKLSPILKVLLERTEMLKSEQSQKMLNEIMSEYISANTYDDCSIVLMSRKNGRFADIKTMTQNEQAVLFGVTTQNRNKRRRMIRRLKKAYMLLS